MIGDGKSPHFRTNPKHSPLRCDWLVLTHLHALRLAGAWFFLSESEQDVRVCVRVRRVTYGFRTSCKRRLFSVLSFIFHAVQKHVLILLLCRL